MYYNVKLAAGAPIIKYYMVPESDNLSRKKGLRILERY